MLVNRLREATSAEEQEEEVEGENVILRGILGPTNIVSPCSSVSRNSRLRRLNENISEDTS